MLPLSLSDRYPLRLVTMSSRGSALSNGALGQERGDVHPDTAEGLARRPVPLVNVDGAVILGRLCWSWPF